MKATIKAALVINNGFEVYFWKSINLGEVKGV
jgi:hypothetical protein